MMPGDWLQFYESRVGTAVVVYVAYENENENDYGNELFGGYRANQQLESMIKNVAPRLGVKKRFTKKRIPGP